MKRYLIYDVRHGQTIMTGELRTKPIARKARREIMKLTGETTRFIVIPGPDHKKWTSQSSKTGQ